MMGDEFDSFRELSGKNLEKLRAMAAANPNLQKSLQMYEQISGRNLSESARKAQEENDRRWERLEADLAKKNLTLGAFSDCILQYGFKLPTPVPTDERSKEGDFVEFMNSYGAQGMDVVNDDYDQEKTQGPHPKCEACGKDAGMKCTQCGERYCSRECQKKAWPVHKKVCKLVPVLIVATMGSEMESSLSSVCLAISLSSNGIGGEIHHPHHLQSKFSKSVHQSLVIPEIPFTVHR